MRILAPKGKKTPPRVVKFVEDTKRNAPGLTNSQIADKIVGEFGESSRIDKGTVGRILGRAGLNTGKRRNTGGTAAPPEASLPEAQLAADIQNQETGPSPGDASQALEVSDKTYQRASEGDDTAGESRDTPDQRQILEADSGISPDFMRAGATLRTLMPNFSNQQLATGPG